MLTKTKNFLQPSLRKDLPDVRPGDTIKVYQKTKADKQEKTKADKQEKTKADKQEKTQVFEGQVLARKHGKEISSTITVRKIISGIGVEKIFPLHSPTIEKIEIVKRGKVKRAKIYYLRDAKGKKSRLKEIGFEKK